MKVHDIFVGMVLLGVGVFVAAYSQTLTAPRNLSYGPGFFPMLVGGGLALCGGALVLQGLSNLKAAPLAVLPDWTGDARKAVRFWILPAAILFYVVFADALGFLATATLIVATVVAVRGASKIRALAVGFAVALVMNIGFASFLHVPLPWGPLTSVSGWLIW
ncbi:tripartite tricarboxylate transporter TctB family protein [Chelativorans sp. AA-79]|uniref:tripartite tricarboxylate transporter TctB family protein n=1 Tax=Chelativorans sp. AA-79 TaxID=3028735 RepID=UPI0023F9A964|nr:tripartite tricarboxylate transporter TctB family protein [Chelativorans sp. AA-79]WEX11025.1 tripartite tricarboxylate transporter TctB family protein [Chelativorans sp. AA-79]